MSGTRKARSGGAVGALFARGARTTILLLTSAVSILLSAEASIDPPSAQASGADAALAIYASDLRIEQRGDSGYHLFIRKKPGIASVLLAETTKDPMGKEPNYAYRAKEWNAANGDELRYLDGKPIPKDKAIWSLIDSTPEGDAAFGEAFHIFIPFVVEWGYPWTRSGSTEIVNGTFVNIRSFSKPYADYAGAFRDNPFEFKVVQKAAVDAPPAAPLAAPPAKPPESPPPGNYSTEAVRSFGEMAKGGGALKYAKPEDLPATMASFLDGAKGKSIDLVIVLDTTKSMNNDIGPVRKSLTALLRTKAAEARSLRVGLVLYRDYGDLYMTKRFDFTSDLALVQSWLDRAEVDGGGDTPEAVYEAIDLALAQLWDADRRIVLVVGDAPPHPIPMGKVTKESVEAKARDFNVELDLVLLPQ